MSHSFSVVSASYDATMGQHNPRVRIVGTVNGRRFPISVFWHQVQTANASGGSTAVQQTLAAILLDWAVIYRFVPAVPVEQVPIFYADNIPGPLPPNANNGWVSVPEALVGSWTA